jgi:glycosyltransferase involved in cell wall biosynthesis
MTVAIVIAGYNHGHYIADAIESALAQTHPVSVVVVNDGSTDDTSEVARRYPVRLLEQPNRGVSAARNAGIASTDATHILCLDADDMLEPETVETLLGLDDIVVPSVRTFGATDSGWIPELAHPTAHDFTLANYSTCCALYVRDAWETIGGYDEAMRDGGEDWDFWTRCLAAGYSMTVVSDKLFRYRVYDRPMTERPNSSGRLRSKLDEVMAYMHAKWRRMGIE